jgi:hypothetical protein
MAVAFGFLPVALADDKNEQPKWVVDQFDKAWGIKLKSVAMKDSGGSFTEVKMTLEFTKDVPDVEEMRKAFAAGFGTPPKARRGTPPNPVNHPILFYVFDKENVSIGKFAISRIEGDLTGVKGDAFRIILVIPNYTLKEAKKVEGRLAKNHRRRRTDAEVERGYLPCPLCSTGSPDPYPQPPFPVARTGRTVL